MQAAKKRLLTLRDLKRAAAKFGGTVESTEGGAHERRHNIDAPPRMMWQANQLHCLTCDTFPGRPDWSSETIADAIQSINYGVEPCDVPDCDYCRELDEQAEQA